MKEINGNFWGCSKKESQYLRSPILFGDRSQNLNGLWERLNLKPLICLESMIPLEYSPQINLTLTDDYPWAQAIVIISANPSNIAEVS